MDVVEAKEPPIRDGHGLRPESSRSRRVALALTLFVGPGVGHAYLGCVRRGFMWAGLPPAGVLLICASVIHARAGYALIAPSVLLFFLARLGALIDVFLVPRGALRRTSWWWVLLFGLGFAVYTVGVMLVIRTSIVEAFEIPAAGMAPTLFVRDHLFVATGEYRHQPPKRGQMAVFTHPEQNADYVYRVIAVPGDKLEVWDGRPIINGWPVPHCTVGRDVAFPSGASPDEALQHGRLEVEWLGAETYLVFIEDDRLVDRAQRFPVPPGQTFVLGDNRNDAADSRFWFAGRSGGVPSANLIGRPLFVWLAFAPDGAIDWSRLNLRLDEPHLPPTLAALEPALHACLRSKPVQTEPPAPE